MTRKQWVLFFFSVAVSILFWTWLISIKLALALIIPLMIHEYGHYWWMEKEGIKKRQMIAIPPLGAMAIAKEPWQSRGAEARISLAGPIVGLIPALVVLFYWYFFDSAPIFAATVFLVSLMNLFNLLFPAPILDGGRVTKSILFSLGHAPGMLFYNLCFLFMIYTFLFTPFFPLIIIFVGYLSFRDFVNLKGLVHKLKQAEIHLSDLSEEEEKMKSFKNDLLGAGGNRNLIEERMNGVIEGILLEKNGTEKIKELIDSKVNLPKMSSKEMAISFLSFVTINSIYAYLIYWMSFFVQFNIIVDYF